MTSPWSFAACPERFDLPPAALGLPANAPKSVMVMPAAGPLRGNSRRDGRTWAVFTYENGAVCSERSKCEILCNEFDGANAIIDIAREGDG